MGWRETVVLKSVFKKSGRKDKDGLRNMGNVRDGFLHETRGLTFNFYPSTG